MAGVSPLLMGIPRYRIFVSSPSDLRPERDVCGQILNELTQQYRHLLEIEPVLWEDRGPYAAIKSFQDQIPAVEEMDVVIVMLWSRLGTPLPDTFPQARAVMLPGETTPPTGTIYEYRAALRACEASQSGKPAVFLYRKTAKLGIAPDAKAEDRQAFNRDLDLVSAFFKGPECRDDLGGSRRACNNFVDVHDLQQRARADFRSLIAQAVKHYGLDRRKSAGWRQSPYRGLECFEFEHTSVFFGRSLAVTEVCRRLREGAARGVAFTLAVGMSGGGKSSLIRAGVLPALVRLGRSDASSLWRRVVFRPGSAAGEGDAFEALARALLTVENDPEVGLPELRRNAEESESALAERLRRNPTSADDFVALALQSLSRMAGTVKRENLRRQIQELRHAGRVDEADRVTGELAGFQDPEARLALCVDQMEEMFTESRLAATRDAFFELLEQLAKGGAVWVIATMRNDFLADCEKAPALGRLMDLSAPYVVSPPQVADVAEMVRQPAEIAGLEFERESETGETLDHFILRDFQSETAALPLLELVLAELYDARKEDYLLTFEAYRQLGGLSGALARRADEALAFVAEGLPEYDSALSRVFGALVHLPSPETVTARRALLTEFANDSAAQLLIKGFVSRRLFVVEQDSVRVTHEALFTWPRFTEWIRAHQQFQIARGRIQRRMELWRQQDDRSELLAGGALLEARSIYANFRSELSPAECAFIAQSLSAAQSNRRRLYTVAASVVAAIIVLGGLGWWQYGRANRLHVKAESIRGRAEDLVSFLMVDLRDQLDPVATLPVLQGVNAKAADYLDSVQPEDRRNSTLHLQALELDSRGDDFFAQGKLAEALRAYEQSQMIRTQLLTNEPGSLVFRRNLVVSYNKLSSARQRNQRLEDALKNSLDALRLAQELGNAPEAKLIHRRDLALTCYHTSELQYQTGRTVEAEANVEAGLAITQKLADAKDPDPRVVRDHVIGLHQKARLLMAHNTPNKTAQALQILQDAKTRQETLSQTQPDNRQLSHDLSVTYELLADAHEKLGQAKEAELLRRMASTLMQGLVTNDLNNAQWQLELAKTRIRHAVMAKDAGDFDRAVIEFDGTRLALEPLLAVEGSQTEARLLLAETCAQLGGLLPYIENPTDRSRKLLQQAAELFRKLQADGALDEKRIKFLADIESELAQPAR